MRPTSKVIIFLVINLVGALGYAETQPEVGCKIDGIVSALEQDEILGNFDVTNCDPEVDDKKLADAVARFIGKSKDNNKIEKALLLVEKIKLSYAGLAESRFRGFATVLKENLSSLNLSFTLPSQGRNLLSNLTKKLTERLPPPPHPPLPRDVQEIRQRLGDIEGRVRSVEEGVEGSTSEIQALRSQMDSLSIKIDSLSEKFQSLSGGSGIDHVTAGHLARVIDSVNSSKTALRIISGLTLASLGLLAYLLIKRIKEPNLAADYAELKDATVKDSKEFDKKLEELGNALKANRPSIEEPPGWRGTLEHELGLFEERIEERLAAHQVAPNPTGNIRSIAEIKQNINKLFESVGELLAKDAKPSDAPSSSSLPLEIDILRETWKMFQDNRDLVTVLERGKTIKWEEIRKPLLSQLPAVVSEKLRPTFDTVVAPARDFHNLTTKIGLIQRLLSGNLPPLSTEHQNLMRTREFINLLTMIQNSNLVADRLSFRLERWVEDQFLDFADLYLQEYQVARLKGDGAHLEPGLQIVRRVLKVADLEPADLALGVTVFDSARHIGRSTTSDPNFANGLILGVVRNGFLRGGQVLRQPEVIVNRVG
jgi:hypothetical protein